LSLEGTSKGYSFWLSIWKWSSVPLCPQASGTPANLPFTFRKGW